MNAEPRSFPARERVLAVNVVEVTPGTLSPTMTVFGEVRSRRTLDIRPPVGGTVLETAEALIDGGRVEEGEVLLRIDATEAESALARLEADRQDAAAELRDAERNITLAQDELTAAEEQADLRNQALLRQRDLLDRGVGTSAAVETAELAASSASQSILSRRQALANAEARLDQAKTRLARVEIDLSDAQRRRDDTVIRAAFDGALTDVRTVNGGRVTANEVVARLIDPDALEVSFRVSTSQYAVLLNEAGQLLDRFGNPYYFHPVSEQMIEIRSAGPDGKLWTNDDVALEDETGGEAFKNL